MKLQAVSHRKLYVQIADQIRDLIESGAVQAGAQLPSERELAADLRVSRPTVREALIALEVAGLVEVRVGVGAFVKARRGLAAALPEQGRSPIELMHARTLLEPEAAAMAARNIGEEGKAKLRATVETMRRETAAGRWSASSDRALHMTIADGCGNAVLHEIIGNIWASRGQDLDGRFHSHLAAIQDVREHILEHHEALARAILDGEPDAARQTMGAHLDYVETAMVSVWD